MGSTSEAALDGILERVAAELEEAAAARADDGTTWSRAGTPFARLHRGGLDVRLPDDIAEAALRTPDTRRLDDGGWLRFTPSTRERHVTDRAEAWFVTAWRHAARSA